MLVLYTEQGNVKMYYKNSNTKRSHCYFCHFEVLGLKSSSSGLVALEITANQKLHVEMLNIRGEFSPSISISHQQDSYLRKY